MYHALVEARVPFDLVHEAFLTPEALDRYALVVLANAAALSDAQCEALRAYVGARRRPPGDVRELALRRVRQRGGPTSASATCSASATPAASRAR